MNKNEAVTDKLFDPVLPDKDSLLDQKSLTQNDAAGTSLKNARLLQGIDIAVLAILLKVPVYKLQALEQGRFEVLPDPVFTRALASSMCRILKLDPAPVLQKLPAITTFKVIPQNRGINTPFRTRGDRNAASVWSHISRPAIWLGLVLMASALVLMFLPFFEKEFARLQQTGSLQSIPVQVGESGLVATTVVIPLTRNDSAANGAENTAARNPVATEIVVVAPGPALLPAPSSAPEVTQANVEPVVTFSATGVSNIRVTDASGVVVFNRVLRAGESAAASGTLPMSVVVGRANAVQVQVRGEAFGLGKVSKNNVARFEVK